MLLTKKFLLSHLYFALLQIKGTADAKVVRFTTDFTDFGKWCIYYIIHCISPLQTLLTRVL